MKFLSSVVFVVVLLVGCSPNIAVQRLDKAGPTPRGVPWNLAMTQYTLTITRQVTGCTGNLNGNVTVTATVGKALDPNQQYVLSSNGRWATADITSTLASDGTSTGLNAHSEDATGTVISNIVSLAATAAAALGSAIPNGVGCEDAVNNALRPDIGLKAQQGQVDKDNTDIAVDTANVTRLTALFQAGSVNKKALTAAVDALTAKQSKLTADQTTLSNTLKLVTDTQAVVWPLDSRETATTAPYELPNSALEKWLKWPGKKDANAPLPAGVDVTPFNVSLALYVPDGTGGWKRPVSGSTDLDKEVKVGVPVRVAGLGRLLVCTGKDACETTLNMAWTPDNNHKLGIQPDQPILQLGHWYVIPIAGGRFKSEGAAVTIDANGNPTSLEIYEKTAEIAAATTTASQAATQIAAVPAQIAATKLAHTQAETNQITAENALATAQANQALVVPTASATAQASLATAQANLATAKVNAVNAGPIGALALVTAQNNLAIAQSAASNATQVNAITAQTSLVTAQANQVNAQVSLAKANAALQSLQ
jgi:hypothetical protein